MWSRCALSDKEDVSRCRHCGAVPVLLRAHGFAFYMVMADCLERVHVHVRPAAHAASEQRAKVWLEPHVELGSAQGYDRTQLVRIERLLLENRELLMGRWEEICVEDMTR